MSVNEGGEIGGTETAAVGEGVDGGDRLDQRRRTAGQVEGGPGGRCHVDPVARRHLAGEQLVDAQPDAVPGEASGTG